MTDIIDDLPPLTFAEPGQTWGELAHAFPQTGQWPIIGVDEKYRDHPWRYHHHWQDDPPAPAATLREAFGLDGKDEWSIQEDDFCFECGVVCDRSGELSIGDESSDLSILRELDHSQGDVRHWGGSSALVSVQRASDCLAELGWDGACNSAMLGADTVVILESWQRRFGAYVYAASGSRLTLVVTRPPTTVADARLVAREHFHFCPYDSQFHGFGGIGPYVAGLVRSNRWEFWWD